MTKKFLGGQEIEVDEDGFIQEPEKWTAAVAEDHWRVINYIREYYREFQTAPAVRMLSRKTGTNLAHIYELFPKKAPPPVPAKWQGCLNRQVASNQTLTKSGGRKDMVQVDVLERLPIFRGMDPKVLQAIAQACHVRSYKATHDVFKEGDPARKFYVLLKGRIAIERRVRPSWLHAEGVKSAIIHYLDETEVFGWSAFLEPAVLTASAHCLNDSEVIEIDGKELADMLDEPQNRHDGYLFAKRLATVIASRFSETADRLLGEIEEVETYKAM